MYKYAERLERGSDQRRAAKLRDMGADLSRACEVLVRSGLRSHGGVLLMDACRGDAFPFRQRRVLCRGAIRSRSKEGGWKVSDADRACAGTLLRGLSARWASGSGRTIMNSGRGGRDVHAEGLARCDFRMQISKVTATDRPSHRETTRHLLATSFCLFSLSPFPSRALLSSRTRRFVAVLHRFPRLHSALARCLHLSHTSQPTIQNLRPAHIIIQQPSFPGSLLSPDRIPADQNQPRKHTFTRSIYPWRKQSPTPLQAGVPLYPDHPLWEPWQAPIDRRPPLGKVPVGKHPGVAAVSFHTESEGDKAPLSSSVNLELS